MLLGRQAFARRRAFRRLGVISGATCSSCVVSKHSHVVNAESKRPAMGWIVADMDGTLIGLPGFVAKGRYEAPAESPCLQPLCRWLRAGGRLLVVTSDDGDGPVRRVLQHIPSELLPQVMFSTSDGAALFRCAPSGELTPVADYASDYCLKSDSKYLHSVYAVARKMHVAFFRDLLSDPDLLASLDDTLRAAYDGVLTAIGRGETTIEQSITHDTMLLPGRVKPFGTLVTRKQAGPSSQWLKLPEHISVGGGGGVRPVELPKGWTQARWDNFERSCCPYLIAPFTCVILLGMPRHVSERYCNLVASELDELNLVASRAPNSVWIKCPGVDKGVPVRWLLQACTSEGFATEDAIAFGDMPLGNDAPLASFSSDGMSFVSVGSDAPTDGPLRFHVGGNEHGMAAVISALADVVEIEVDSAKAEDRSPLHFGALNVDLGSTIATAVSALRLSK